jgi:hypothetical protein
MACSFFGPIRLSDSAKITAWTKSCIAGGQVPKWTGPYTSGGQKDWMKCYCCDNATDVPPVDGETGELQLQPENYLVSMTAQALTELVEGKTVSLPFGDRTLHINFSRSA